MLAEFCLAEAMSGVVEDDQGRNLCQERPPS